MKLVSPTTTRILAWSGDRLFLSEPQFPWLYWSALPSPLEVFPPLPCHEVGEMRFFSETLRIGVSEPRSRCGEKDKVERESFLEGREERVPPANSSSACLQSHPRNAPHSLLVPLGNTIRLSHTA